MQNGTSVLGSKRRLRDALFDCLKEKALADVTVKEVCERAGLNRVTFYRNYKTLNDIVSETERERLDQLRTLLTSGKKHGEDLVREVITMLYEAKEIGVYEGVENLFTDFKPEVIRLLKHHALDDCISLFPKVAPLYVELGLEFFIAGVFHIITNSRDRYTCEDVVRIVLVIRDDAIKKYS